MRQHALGHLPSVLSIDVFRAERLAALPRLPLARRVRWDMPRTLWTPGRVVCNAARRRRQNRPRERLQLCSNCPWKRRPVLPAARPPPALHEFLADARWQHLPLRSRVPMTVDSRVPTAPEKDQTQKHYRHSAQVWIPGRPAHFSTTFAANYSYASASSNTPLPVRATARRFRQEFSQRRVSAIIRVARSHRQLQQAPRVHSQCGERCDGRPSGRQQQCEPESPERKDSELLVEYIEFRPAGKAVITTVTNFKLDVQNFRGLQTSTRTLHCGCNLSNRAVWTHTHTHYRCHSHHFMRWMLYNEVFFAL